MRSKARGAHNGADPEGLIRSALRRPKCRPPSRTSVARRRAAFDDTQLEHIRDFDKNEPPSTVGRAPVYVVGSASMKAIRPLRAGKHRRHVHSDSTIYPRFIQHYYIQERVDSALLSVAELRAELAARRLPIKGNKDILRERLERSLTNVEETPVPLEESLDSHARHKKPHPDAPPPEHHLNRSVDVARRRTTRR